MPGDEIFDSIRLRRDGVDFTQWPKLSCSDANQLDLDVSDLRLDADHALLFQGNGQIRTAGSLRLFTDTPIATEKLTILPNGNVGIGNAAPTTKLEVNGSVKAMSFQGDGSALTNLSVQASQWQNGASSSISYSSGNVGIGTTTPQGKLEVNGDIRAGNSDLYFTKIDHNHTGIGNTPGWAAIENSAVHEALMILGRNQGTASSISRIVKLWDYLQVNGNLEVTGNIIGRVAGIGFASASVSNGQTIPVPAGFTRPECVFFASIKFLNFRVGEAVSVNCFVDTTGKVTATPEGKVVAIGVAIAKKGGW
ncbi:hypothetical protein [Phormidesmis priestleyi]